MRDTCKPYRQAIFTCLDGNLGSVGGNLVRVYDEKSRDIPTVPVFVLLSTQQETPSNTNDCTFITRSSIDIEIVVKTGFQVTKDTADDLSNIILGLIIPDTQTSGLTTPSGFQFLIPVCTKTLTRNVSITDTQSILVKILTIVTEIVTQN